MLKSTQGKQYSSGNQKNIIQGQRLDIENRNIQQRTKAKYKAMQNNGNNY